MIDITMLSSRYAVRRLDETDVDEILRLYEENPQFFRYCEMQPTKAQVLNDLHIAPPGIGLSDKYVVGFYGEDGLIAVMDLIDGYPEQGTAYIGLFILKKACQGRQLGTAMIREAAAGLKAAGKTAIRLAINRGNPQSAHFWKKNGFCVIKEVEKNGWMYLVAEKKL